MKHVDHLIDHLLDGRLSADQERDLRGHCESCAECARRLREAEAFLRTLDVDATPKLGASLWPDVQRDIEMKEQPISPLARLRFVGGGVAAMAAGLVLGVWLTAAPVTETDDWSLLDQGIALAGESGSSFDSIVLAAWQDEEETP